MSELPKLDPNLQRIIEAERTSYDAMVKAGEPERALADLLRKKAENAREQSMSPPVPWYFSWKFAAAILALVILGPLVFLFIFASSRTAVPIIADLPDASVNAGVATTEATIPPPLSTAVSTAPLRATTLPKRSIVPTSTARPHPFPVATGTAAHP